MTFFQGCPQDVKSRDQDGQPSRPRRDRDVPFFQTLKTEMLNPQDRDETFNLKDRDETFQKTSQDRDARPRRSKKTYQDRSVAV